MADDLPSLSDARESVSAQINENIDVGSRLTAWGGADS